HAGASADEVSACHQSQDLQNVGPRRADASPADCRRGDRMKRREFVTLLGSAAAAWPLAARAQQSGNPVIGFLSARSAKESAHLVEAFRKGLAEYGVIEGQNATVDYNWADSHYERLHGQAIDLVSRQVAVLVSVGGDMTAKAAVAATRT